MPRFFLFIFLFLLLYTILHYLIKNMFIQRKKLNREFESEELVQDPHCQTYIPKRTAVRKRVRGREYYFCNKECAEKFLAEKKSQKSEGSSTET
jgi:YHS domain-containing protein